MALVDKSYSEYPNVNTINESDLFLISSDFPNGYDTRKTTTRTLANAINNQLPMASLDTENKTVVNAINELKSVIDEMFVKPNETITTDYVITGSFITSSQTLFFITVPVAKSLKNVNTVEVTSVVAGVRTVEGKYLNNSSDEYEWVGKNGITIEAMICKKTNTIRVLIRTSSAFVNAPPNNTPLGIANRSATFKFT